jgi:hypothetical protein
MHENRFRCDWCETEPVGDLVVYFGAMVAPGADANDDVDQGATLHACGECWARFIVTNATQVPRMTPQSEGRPMPIAYAWGMLIDYWLAMLPRVHILWVGGDSECENIHWERAEGGWRRCTRGGDSQPNYSDEDVRKSIVTATALDRPEKTWAEVEAMPLLDGWGNEVPR